MKRRLVFAWCALALSHSPEARAQFTDAHNYDNTPVGSNQLELGYALVNGSSSIDTSLVIATASLTLNQATIGYTRYFALFGRLMWVDAAVPLANLGGSLSSVRVERSIAGTGDSSYSLAMLLKGGPALGVAE